MLNKIYVYFGPTNYIFVRVENKFGFKSSRFVLLFYSKIFNIISVSNKIGRCDSNSTNLIKINLD